MSESNVNSYGNNNSNGNNYSRGNNNSNGNNYSRGNNYSDGNNCSDGNNWSYFLFDCRGSHKSILCIGKRGIANMVLNQQLTNEQSKDFWQKLKDIRNGWLPYTTNFCEMKDKGWHKEYDEKNEYVSEKMKNDETPYLKQYHHAWESCPVKQEIIDLIKSCEYLKTDEALDVFTQITGIPTDHTDIVEMTLEEVAKLKGVPVEKLRIRK